MTQVVYNDGSQEGISMCRAVDGFLMQAMARGGRLKSSVETDHIGHITLNSVSSDDQP